MRRPFPIEREPAPRWSSAAWISLSALLHGLLLFLSSIFLKPPELDIEFELPMDVELGTADGLALAPSSPVSPPEPVPASDPARAAGAGGDQDGGLPDAGIADASLADAAAADASVRRRDAGVRDAGVREDAGALLASGDAGAARLPPGAQIALRVDMTRIRNSPIASDVRALLSSIPDWKALLDGSGIDPITQLDRLLIATPNLQREKIVLAGRYLGGEAVVREAVERMGQARRVATPWHAQGGVQVAPWANADATPRMIALIGPEHFAIAREEDLPRILAIASARARGKKRGGPHPADALLSMEDDEGLSIEIEGAAQFVRKGRRGIPERLRVSAVERPKLRAELRGSFSYEDAAKAADAQDYWRALRDNYASNALVALLGLSDPLEDATIEQDGTDVKILVTLTAEQMRLIMGYVRELLAPPSRP